MYDWIHDDTIWCGNECAHTDCERNQVNILDNTGWHSYVLFKGTEVCPYHKPEKEKKDENE